MKTTGQAHAAWSILAAIVTTALLAIAILAICLLAPTEKTMGDTQRIVYVHVAVAWFGLMSFLVMAGTGLKYLLCRDLAWDQWSQAAAEVGWLCGGLTLLTGSFWAHAAWGTWWTWDPRLTFALILWMMYSGYLILRTSIEDPHRRARAGAVVAIVGTLDIPLVLMAARWFRGIHPASPEMDPTMRVVLLLSVVGFSVFLVSLVVLRRTQLRMESLLVAMEQRLDDKNYGAE